MSYLDLLVDRQIREAIERGEFDGLPGAGRPIADLDHQRQPGWFAESLVRRERSRILRQDTLASSSAQRAQFWRAASVDALRRLVHDTNREVAAANVRLEPDDRIELIDFHDVLAAWRTNRVDRPSG